MSTDERYNGWTNRETWAVALHVNNDQGWQESVLSDIRGRLETIEDANRDGAEYVELEPWEAGDVVRENVESVLDMLWETGGGTDAREALRLIVDDLGSLWRVDWTELGAAFLEDVRETA